MATLNVKDLPDSLYQKLRARAKRDRRSLAQEVIQVVAQATEEPTSPSILDLKGLGVVKTQPHSSNRSAVLGIDG